MPRRIFVSNFDDSIDEHDLERLFSPWGIVKRTCVRRNRKTGESQGFGFVEMKGEVNAEFAVKHVDGVWWRGRTLKVTFARYRQRGPDPER